MKKKLLLILWIFLLFFSSNVIAKVSDKPSENYANIVFFAYFPGTEQEMQEDIEYFKSNSQKLLDYYDGTSGRSFTNYLDTISYGKFKVKNISPQVKNGIIEPIKLDIDIASANKRNVDTDLIDKMVNTYSSISGTVDYDGDGFIDNVTIIVKQRDGYEALSESSLVSHKSNYPGTKRYLNKYVGTYNIIGTKSVENNESGVLAHEFLHSIGYSDLYRSESADDYPVYVWDIMSNANIGMSYPLAYLRSEISNWIDIETVTESRSLRLDEQTNANGNQAFILKSPLNDYEFFVVEFRKKNMGVETLDRHIGGSGVIVYRVNTTVEGFSNFRGETGIYVFRPQTGFDNERLKAYNAYLSLESGRTSIGTKDMNKGLADGALTFTDGSNSGIVIKNVSSAEGSYMTLDVEIPNKEDFDLWKNLNHPDLIQNETMKKYSILKHNNKIYSVSCTTNKIYTQVLENNTWKTLGTYSDAEFNSFTNIETLETNNEAYLIANYNNKLSVYKWNDSSLRWNLVNSYIETSNYIYNFHAEVINNIIYIVGTTNEQAILYKFQNNTLSKVKEYYSSSTEHCGTPRIGNIGNDIYVSTRLANGKILLYKYKNNTFENINVDISGGIHSTHCDLKSLNNKLYFAFDDLNSDKLNVVTYDGNKVQIISSNINLRTPNIVVSQGNLYILGTANNSLYAFAYDEDNRHFTLEGNAIDVGELSYNTSLESIDDTIYVGIEKSNSTFLVKTKQTTNRLKSISIVGPTKTTYELGETFDNTGLRVTATYTNGTKNITNYIVENFNTTKVGNYIATVFYEGKSVTFNYKVIENNNNNNDNTDNKPNVPDETLYNMSIKKGYKIKSNFIHNFSINTSIGTLRNRFDNKVNISSVNTVISTGTKFTYKNESYIAVLYGDLNGDGKINSADLLKMRQHLLGTSVLNGAYKESANLTNDQIINSADLLRLRQHLLGTNTIAQ